MFRNWAQTQKKKRFQTSVTSRASKLEQPKVNLQERLALIRQGNLKESIDKTLDKNKFKSDVLIKEDVPLGKNHTGRQLSSPHSPIGTVSKSQDKSNEESVLQNSPNSQPEVCTIEHVVEKPREIPLTDLENDLNFIVEKMRNLSIHKQNKEIKKTKPSFINMLEKLSLVTESCNINSAPPMRQNMNASNKQTNVFERKRSFSTASTNHIELKKNVGTNLLDEKQHKFSRRILTPLKRIDNLLGSDLSKKNINLNSNKHEVDADICNPSTKNKTLEIKHTEVDNFEGHGYHNEVDVQIPKKNDLDSKKRPSFTKSIEKLSSLLYNIQSNQNHKSDAILQKTEKNTSNSGMNNRSLETKNIKVQSFEQLSLQNKYPFPETTVNQYYQELASRLNDESLKVEPHYLSKKGLLGREWVCTYFLKWPGNYEVSSQCSSKEKARSSAALGCLTLLNHLSTNNSVNKRSFSTDSNNKNLDLFTKIVADVQNQNNVVSTGKTEIASLKNNENSLTTLKPKNKLESTSQKSKLHTKNEILEVKHIKVENFRELRHLQEKFPFPKNALNNYYQLLATELNDKSLKVESCYKSTKSQSGTGTEWISVYHIKWPANYKVSAQCSTKKKASAFAALRCLSLLTELGKISPEGLPLIYNKEEVKKVTQKKQTALNLDNTTLTKMENIVNIFKNNLAPVIEKMDYNNLVYQENKIMDQEVNLITRIPLYLGMHQYLAKEKVDLPISDFKKSFIDLIENNSCVIVKGEPGCGKSSRVPQYVLESWARSAVSEQQLCRIAVTQPRRIAAISLAERVASERDEEVGRVVGYQVRLKSNFIPKTGRLLYCTTGILLRHIQSDPKLTNFSHVILDEAHERDVNTDLLMNLLKKAMKQNDNLRVVVMSATIDAATFSQYFDGAPILDVPGFTYPVTRNYLDHCKLDVSKTLKMCQGENPQVIHDDVVEVLGYIHKNKPEGAILAFLPGWEDLVKVQKLIGNQSDVVVHLVHSKLKDSEQCRIFSRPPPGIRKIILATNIAETSITIDDVVYVVDTGMHKDQLFDNDKGISIIDLAWISKASANQRAGRAGRCAPGESYHLYTRERFDQFEDYTSPKILNSSLTKVVLDSKMFTNNMDACDFMNSLITPPEKFSVERAVDELKQLELLDENEKLTPLGRTLVNFQLEPNLAKAMVNGVVFKCTTPIVDIVTLFSSETGLFGSLSLTNKEHIKNMKSHYCKSSDHLAMMRIYENWLKYYEEYGLNEAQNFCRSANLVPHKLEFVKKLQEVHFGYLSNGLNESLPISDDFSDNDEMVKAVLYSGTGTVLEHRNWDIVKKRLKTNANVLVTRNNHKATIASESVNYKRHKYPSNFLVYINETRSNIRRTTIVRESSLIPAISVLLFTNKELEILDALSRDPVLSDDLVIVGIKNTNLQFLCDKNQANTLIDCKKAIEASYKYMIHQLTYANEDIPELLEHWNNILKYLGDILEKFKVD